MKGKGVLACFTILFLAGNVIILRAQANPSLELFGVIGTGPPTGDHSHFVIVDQTTGDAKEIGPTPNFYDIQEMTFDSNTGKLYAVADATLSDPKLITIDPATGLATLIGLIVLAGHDPTFIEICESIAFNPTGRPSLRSCWRLSCLCSQQ